MRRSSILFCVLSTACEPLGPGPAAIELVPPPTELEALRRSSTARESPPPTPKPGAIQTSPMEREPPLPRAARVDPARVGRGATKRWFLALSREDRHVVRAACRARARNPCWQIRRPDDDRAAIFFPLGGEQEDRMHDFCGQTVGHGRGCNTPLVVAFDGEPIEYTPATHAFAFRGEAVLTEWPTAATPWIAIDRDGDGAITGGGELFGDATAEHGFAALALLDANHDGVIDHRDPDFARLLLWADANADRQSSPDELSPLADAITAIPLAHRLAPRCAGVNCEGERGIARLRDGRTGAVVDVYLGEHR